MTILSVYTPKGLNIPVLFLLDDGWLNERKYTKACGIPIHLYDTSFGMNEKLNIIDLFPIVPLIIFMGIVLCTDGKANWLPPVCLNLMIE